MRIIILILSALMFLSCSSVMRLDVPKAFSEQATMKHVSGARGNRMSLEGFSVSKIKRGLQSGSKGGNNAFFLENLLLGQIGISKSQSTERQKAKFRFTLSDGSRKVNVFGKETEFTSNTKYRIPGGRGVFDNLSQTQEYSYIFSAILEMDSLPGAKNWELLMTNMYDRKSDTAKKLITIIRPDDNGLATNGKDTLFLKGLSINKTQSARGKELTWPGNFLGGYEISTSEGVVAIIDTFGRNIWFYNELDAAEKLTISAIATAIFARNVKIT